jgi:hypothetical protein
MINFCFEFINHLNQNFFNHDILKLIFKIIIIIIINSLIINQIKQNQICNNLNLLNLLFIYQNFHK